MKVNEGYFPFHGYSTYYRTVGEPDAQKAPLILLHGGPGSTHNYLEMLDDLGKDRWVIMYDQIGCGLSYLEGHPELWKAETWIAELEALYDYFKIKKAHLLGQSWGGMLAQLFALHRHNQGICSLILSSTLSSASLWSQEQHRRIRHMSLADQTAFQEAEESGNYSSVAYLQAVDRFMQRYCAGAVSENDPWCLRKEKKIGHEAYLYGWGPNEFTPNGSLKDYEITERLAEITVPCLVISGTDDLSSPLVAKTMADHLPNSRWELFANCRHCCYIEDNAKYLRLVREFLQKVEHTWNN